MLKNPKGWLRHWKALKKVGFTAVPWLPTQLWSTVIRVMSMMLYEHTKYKLILIILSSFFQWGGGWSWFGATNILLSYNLAAHVWLGIPVAVGQLFCCLILWIQQLGGGRCWVPSTFMALGGSCGIGKLKQGVVRAWNLWGDVYPMQAISLWNI